MAQMPRSDGRELSRREVVTALGAAGALAVFGGLTGCSSSEDGEGTDAEQETTSEAAQEAADQKTVAQKTAPDGIRASGPVQRDWEGRWAAGEASVEYDEQIQTCRATVPYESLWFETCEGDKVYLYEWTCDGWTYVGEADDSAPVTYENLVGDYSLSGSAEMQTITRFVVESVEGDGSIEATATWVADEKYQDRRELSIPLTGTVLAAQQSDGTHQAVATLDGWTEDGFYLGVSFIANDFMYGKESNTVKSMRLDYAIEERTYAGAYYVTGFRSMGDFEVIEGEKATA